MLWRLFFRGRKLPSSRKFHYKTQRFLRSFVYTFNVHTLLLLLVSFVAVFISTRLELRYNMDFALVATGTTFPLVFTITQAFGRRERALSLIANLKASVVALYYMHRDWDQTFNYPQSLGNDSIESARKAKVLLMDLMVNFRKYITARSGLESSAEARIEAARNGLLQLFEHEIHLMEKDRVFISAFRTLESADPGRKFFMECYKITSKLSVLNEKLTLAAGYTRGGEGGLSRTNQYLRYIISNLEELRMIKEYRTPSMMRHACGFLFHVFAVVLAPYWVHFCDSWTSAHHSEKTCAAGYMSAFCYVMIVMLLYHIQQDIENPFDETGLDDVFFTLPTELDEVLGEDHLLHSCRSSMTDIHRMGRASSPKAARGMDMLGYVLDRRLSSDGLYPTLRTIPSDRSIGSVELGAPPLLTKRSSGGGGSLQQIVVTGGPSEAAPDRSISRHQPSINGLSSAGTAEEATFDGKQAV